MLRGQARRAGLGSSAASMIIARLAAYGCLEEGVVGGEADPRTVLVVAADTLEAEKLLSDLSFYFSPMPGVESARQALQVQSFFGWEVLPFDLLSPAPAVSASRLSTLFRLAQGSPTVVVATAQALMQRMVYPGALSETAFVLKAGEAVEREELISLLERGGYVQASLVEECGQMAIRGAVVDFFPPGFDSPVRAELFGDRVESLRIFSTEDQRSRRDLSQVNILPAREFFFWNATDHQTMSGLVQDALLRLRARASELSIPQIQVRPIEEALTLGTSWPGLEHLQPLVAPELGTFFDYLPSEAPVFLWDEQAIVASADDFSTLLEERSVRAVSEGRIFPDPKTAYLSSDTLLAELKQRTTIFFDKVSVLAGSLDEDDVGPAPQSFGPKIVSNGKLRADLSASRSKERPFQPLAEEVERRQSQGCAIAITVGSSQRVRRLEELLRGYDVDAVLFEGGFLSWFGLKRERRKAKLVYLLPGVLSSGFRAVEERMQLISEAELFPEVRKRSPIPGPGALRARKLLGSASQLKENDFVVHVDYGIGLYRGLRVLSVEGKDGDFLELEYADEARLYVPVENIGKVQKYSASEGKKPALTKLGGKTWEKVKKKVQKNVAELAGQLLTVMAKRHIAERPSYGEVDEDDRMFADAFPYEETSDQSTAIADVLADLARSKPMDRLVCGDVGYGKTEVALRAAFKVAHGGAQVALLVPTTVLS